MKESFPEIPKDTSLTEMYVSIDRERKIDLLQNLIDRKFVNFENALDTIDFKLLESLFQKRIHPYFNKENFISRWDIAHEALSTSFALYESKHKVIVVDYDSVASSDEKKINEYRLLHAVIHEETHALSNPTHSINETEDVYISERQIGFDQHKITIPKFDKEETYEIDYENQKSQRIFHFFNEGVTEKFTREIFDEYATYKQFELTKEDKQEMLNIYDLNIQFFDLIVGYIAQKLHLEKQYITEAFYGSMFKGEDLADPELQKAFTEAISPSLSKTLTLFDNFKNDQEGDSIYT